MKPLFTTDEELKPFLPLTTSFKLAAVATFLLRVQQKQIRDALGREMLAELVDAYTAATEASPLAESLASLLSEVRVPLTSFGFALYAPHSGIQFTGAGARQAGTEALKPARPADLVALADTLNDAGEAGMEALLEFLEENRATYTTWAESDACTVLHGELLATAKEFNRFVFIDESRRRFRELQPNLRDAQRLAIRPLLGDEMLEELRSQKQAGQLTPANKLLLSYVLPALANGAVRDDASRCVMADTYLEELREFLYGHAPDYPTFTASSAYKPEVSTVLQQNDAWGFFGGF